MRITLQLTPESPLLVPLHHNQAIQGFIYHHLSPEVATRTHESGTQVGNKVFRMFTFSRIQEHGSYDDRDRTLRYPAHQPFSFVVASTHHDILSDLASRLLKHPEVHFHQTRCKVTGVQIHPTSALQRPLRVRALTGITAYHTYHLPSGRRQTHYYAPQDPEWSEQLVNNLKDKARALGWEEDHVGQMQGEIRPAYVRPHHKKVANYKGTWIEGWLGEYTLDLPEPLLELALDTGLGSKNSQGFGLVEPI